MTVVPKGGNDLEFKVDGDGGWKKAHFGNKVATKYGPIAITKTKNFTEHHKDFTVIVRVNTPNMLAKKIVGALTAEQADKLSDVLRLSLTWDNKDEPSTSSTPSSCPTTRRQLTTRTLLHDRPRRSSPSVSRRCLRT